MSWFPIHVEQIEHPSFHSLTPTQKLYMWFIISEFNLRGQFYLSDLQAAVTIGAKEETIRKARPILQNLGFIETRPGFKGADGRGVATSYLAVPWARTPKKGEGKQFKKQDRYTFETLLEQVRNDQFSISDVVVYVYLNYIRQFNQKDDAFYISKSELKELTNIQKADECIRNLYNNFTYSGGEHLFEFEDRYHGFRIEEWAQAKVDGERAYQRLQEIRTKVEQIRQAQRGREIERANERGELIDPVQLPDMFKELYKQRYGKKPALDWGQEERLIELGKKHGVKGVGNRLRQYMTADVVPNPTNAKHRTLGRFLRIYEELDEQTG